MYENEQIIAVSLYSEGSVCLSRPAAPAAGRARTTSRAAPLLVGTRRRLYHLSRVFIFHFTWH